MFCLLKTVMKLSYLESRSWTFVSKLSRDKIRLMVSEGESGISATFIGLPVLPPPPERIPSKFLGFSGLLSSETTSIFLGLSLPALTGCSFAIREAFLAEVRFLLRSIIFATFGSIFVNLFSFWPANNN